MSQKNNKTRITVWTAVIGALGIIIGAAIGYLGAKQNAETQAWITTQTAEAKITPIYTLPVPNDNRTLAIEYIPQMVFAYAGNNNPDGGWAALSVVYDDAHKLNYRFEYALPEDKYGYAGMVFNFPKGYSLTEYDALTFTIIFENPNDEIDLVIKDISQNSNTIRIKGNGDEQMELRYDFTNFSNVDFNAVLEIGLSANTDFSRGGHEISINNIRLINSGLSPILETPNPTLTLQAAYDIVNNQFDNLLKTNIAFNKPHKMEKGDTTTIELVLNPSLSKADLATQVVEHGNFDASTGEPNVLIGPNDEEITVVTSQIEITPRMKVVLTPQDTEAFTVTEMHENAEQVVSTVETTTWRWSVTAKKEGQQSLELVMYQLVKYDGKEFWHEVKTYKTDIVVEVTVGDRVKSLDWKWIAGFIITLVGSFIGILTYRNNQKSKIAENNPALPKRIK